MTPLDITEISSSVIAFLVPYLSTKAKQYAEEKISEKVENNLDSEIESLYKKMKSRFKRNSEADKTLENLEKEPENIEFQRKTERILEDMLVRDIQFKEIIEKLLLNIEKSNQSITNNIVKVNATNGSIAAGKNVNLYGDFVYQVQQPSSNPSDPYISFQISEKEALKEASWQMSQGDYTPDDILLKSKLDNNFRLYVPFHFVKGTYSATLTYIAVTSEDYEETTQNYAGENVQVTKTRHNRNPTKKEIYPQNFKELAIATSLDSLLPSGLEVLGLEEFCEEINFLENDIRPDIKVSSDGIKFISSNYKVIDSESKIKKRIKERINSTIYKELEGDSQERKNLSHNISIENVKRLYLPFWFFIYSYNNKEYLLVIDGKDLKRVYDEHKPIDKEKHNKRNKIYWEYCLKPIFLSTFLVFLIFIFDENLLIENFSILLIILFLLVVISLLVANSKVKGMINESKQRREEIYKKLV